MSAKIYVGNLSWNTTDDSLRDAFSQFGQVLDSIVMRDRETGRSRGFGFVTYGSQEEAESAIANQNEQEFDGRRVKVNLANARRRSNSTSQIKVARDFKTKFETVEPEPVFEESMAEPDEEGLRLEKQSTASTSDASEKSIEDEVKE